MLSYDIVLCLCSSEDSEVDEAVVSLRDDVFGLGQSGSNIIIWSLGYMQPLLSTILCQDYVADVKVCIQTCLLVSFLRLDHFSPLWGNIGILV